MPGETWELLTDGAPTFEVHHDDYDDEAFLRLVKSWQAKNLMLAPTRPNTKKRHLRWDQAPANSFTVMKILDTDEVPLKKGQAAREREVYLLLHNPYVTYANRKEFGFEEGRRAVNFLDPSLKDQFSD